MTGKRKGLPSSVPAWLEVVSDRPGSRTAARIRDRKRVVSGPAAWRGFANVASGAARSAFASAWVVVPACGALMVLAAQVRVPVPGSEVPMTLQSLAVLLTGFALRPTRAASAMVLYLALGAAGLPVFVAGSGGVFGLTGGYLVAFVPAAWLVSLAKGGADAACFRLLAAGALGTAVVFALGVTWRAVLFGGDWPLALETGLLPFAAKALAQVFLAAAVVVSLRPSRRRYVGGGAPT